MRISPDSLAAYVATAQKSWAEERRRLALRHERAWVIARQAADLLRSEYGVDRVRLFGSLVRSELFHTRSDIDLAVWGLDEKHYYRAVARLLALDAAFEIDLVMGEAISASMLAVLEREGATYEHQLYCPDLGLNISHNIVVQKHRGEIAVHSEPGATCFRVRLPLNFDDMHVSG